MNESTGEKMAPELRVLFETMPQAGRVETIQVRPAKAAPVVSLNSVLATADGGLAGERTDGGKTRKRQVTLIQHEHLAAVASILQREDLDPALTHRNLVVSGINLRALLHARFQIGEAVFQGTVECPPCSLMERNLGPGGYNAMLGHGGLCAQVVRDGLIRVGDAVLFLELV